jgi:uncharacterized protein YdeI (YjbR/CyaY-like superfamily)
MTGKKAEAHLEAKFFRDAATFRRWLEKYHDRKDELWMGYYKKGSGKGGLTYMDALDEALCFGWIDGITKSIDDERYSQRWTPRRPTSIWSERNIDKVKKLTADGLAAFQQRSAEKSGVYSFEQEKVELTPEFELRLRSRKHAAAFFDRQPPWYRRTAIWWVISAKKPETRERRFEELLRASTAETWVGPLQRDRERKK